MTDNQDKEEEKMLGLEPYVRLPFRVKAVQITRENIDEIAKLIGFGRNNGVRMKNGEPFINLHHDRVPNMTRAFLGCYLTVFAGGYRVYYQRVFEEQFKLISSEDEVLHLEIPVADEEMSPEPAEEVDIYATDEPQSERTSERFDVV